MNKIGKQEIWYKYRYITWKAISNFSLPANISKNIIYLLQYEF